MPGYVVESLAVIKALEGDDRVDNLALIKAGTNPAWYIYDITSTELGDDDNVITPNDGIGRWLKMNNSNNPYNKLTTLSTSGSSIEVNPNISEIVQLTLNEDVTINFPTSIRNGNFRLVIIRNGYDITGWDNRLDKTYEFSASALSSIIDLLIVNNVIYLIKVNEYA